MPWFWRAEYQRDVPEGFELTVDEEEYRRAFMLTLGQMAWRRNKIDTDFRGDTSLFDQEYPASAELAFASSEAAQPDQSDFGRPRAGTVTWTP